MILWPRSDDKPLMKEIPKDHRTAKTKTHAIQMVDTKPPS